MPADLSGREPPLRIDDEFAGWAPAFTVWIVRRGQKFPMIIDSIWTDEATAKKRVALFPKGQGWEAQPYSHLQPIASLLASEQAPAHASPDAEAVTGVAPNRGDSGQFSQGDAMNTNVEPKDPDPKYAEFNGQADHVLIDSGAILHQNGIPVLLIAGALVRVARGNAPMLTGYHMGPAYDQPEKG